ncbi:DNA polymerase kappa-like [Salmo trutta]|uniref:DNA polymerase kappa-like n=1 Tax=Salmo trutta TaxID=8032 RepID=UPI0011322E67|nr:DNA polymerase kappa-like [Salmo trutta]
MEGLDRDKINKIIMKSSKGSRFYENEMKKEQQVNLRIERMMLQKAHITEQQLSKAQTQVEKMTFDLESVRDLSRVIVHVDMDAFYAAVETRDCPDLKDKPMAVGSMSMLTTSNYHARKLGVRAAMPGFIAKKLCPNLVIVPTDFDKYRAVSTEVREIFADYDPHFLPMSLDEAYLDISEHLEQRRVWPEALRSHRLRTNDPGTATSVSVPGIAPNMMLAKVCSDKNKPNGQYRLPSNRQAVMVFIQDLPVRKVSGIGKVTEKMLGALGITSCIHLGQEMALLALLFSETSWHHFLDISLGLGSTHIERDGERKSMSTERTFGEMSALEEQFSLCRQLCQDLAQELQKEVLSRYSTAVVFNSLLGDPQLINSLLGDPQLINSLLGDPQLINSVLEDPQLINPLLGDPQLINPLLRDPQLINSLLGDPHQINGKTVTLKLKNVNFEVKTRAWTLPCAVAASDKLFAVAKDLLTTEIDNVSPQPLRLRLMGIRVSSFVSADDKKPLQKSIVGFLQQGRADSSSPSQISSHKPVKEHQPKPPGQTQLFPCPSLVQQCQGQEDHPWVPSWGGVEVGRTGEQQQSFFQRARAQRLRLQAEREDPPEDGKWNVLETRLGPASSATKPKQTPIQKNPNTSAETHFSMSALTASDNMTHAPTAKCTEAHVSTSLCWSTEPGTDSLTCPVCFREVNTTDLIVFNRHVDQCLSGVPMEHNIHTDTELERLQCGPRPMTTPKVESHDPREPALTCPVCQVTQDTDNLTLFHRHVDLCLNQEVLHELEGMASVDHTTHNATPAAHKEREQPLRRAPQKGKSKRRGSSPPPPSKKAKALGPARNTIDKFFR